MQIVRHRFVENYFNATGAKDSDLQGNILLNEVANQIVYNPISVKDIIISSALQVEKTASEKELVEILSNNLGKNTKLQDFLAKLILNSNKTDFSGVQYRDTRKYADLVSNGNTKILTLQFTEMFSEKNKAATKELLSTQVENKKQLYIYQEPDNIPKPNYLRTLTIYAVSFGIITYIWAVLYKSVHRGK